MSDWRALDPVWFRKRWPALALPGGDPALVQWFHKKDRGLAANPFQDPIRLARGKTSPHWLFDPDFYRKELRGRGERLPVDAYGHFLEIGDQMGLRPGRFFLARTYLAGLPDAEREAARAEGAFRHFVRHSTPCRAEPQLSPYFDPAWYLARHPDAAEALASGQVPSALAHYLLHRGERLLDPLPQFSEQSYRQRNPDVAAAIAQGSQICGYDHFLCHGQHEGRSFGSGPDLRQYLALNRSAPREMAAEGLPDLFAHMLVHLPPPAIRVDENFARALFRMQAEIGLFRRRRTPLDFTPTAEPLVSVVMVLHNNIALTVATLESLHGQLSGRIELVLVDSGSTDETRAIGDMVRGARILRHEENIHFVAGSNAGIAQAGAGAVLLLNNDTRLAPDAVALALARLRSAPDIGAVGGKVVRSHGLLQEAGSILYSDGTTAGYLRGADPDASEANFLREVDFCSGVFLMVDTGLLRRLGGFDPAYSPAYFEDVDLCLRIRRAGLRVIYDPKIRIEHLEYGSSGSEGALSLIAKNLQTLRERQAEALARQRPPATSPHLARSPDPARRVLLVEDYIPLRRTGAGYVRSNDIVTMLADLGCRVTVLGMMHPLGRAAELAADYPETVELLHDRSFADLPELAVDRAQGFDLLWVCRSHNLARIAPLARAFAPRLIFDTEAIATTRAAQIAALAGQEFDADARLSEELRDLDLADLGIAVSQEEAGILARQGRTPVAVLGHMIRPRPAPGPEGRQGMLFFGALHDKASPNHDSLFWFVRNVLDPMTAAGAGLSLTIAGYLGETVDLAEFEGRADIRLVGPVDDPAPLFDSHRLFVAPTRFAAGIPHKLHEAAGQGLPAVASDLLCRQLAWRDDDEILSAPVGDAQAFIRQIRRLSTDDDLWRRLQSGAQQRLRDENSPEAFRRTLAGLIDQR